MLKLCGFHISNYFNSKRYPRNYNCLYSNRHSIGLYQCKNSHCNCKSCTVTYRYRRNNL